MASFDIRGKVAIITGGASGIGFQYALQLLEKGAKGVTLADINLDVGNKAIQEIEGKFGTNKALFVKTDVTSYEQFEDAFKKTIEKFGNVDILINNAGVLDKIWQNVVAINMNGVIHGMLLGLEHYLPKYKSGSEGVIVNMSSVAGVGPLGCEPVYTGTKFAVHGMTLSWGLPCHYERVKVRVVGICPGVTITPLLVDIRVNSRSLGPAYNEIRREEFKIPEQTPEQIALHTMRVIERAPSGTMWVIEGGEAPYQYQLPDRFKLTEKVQLP